MVKRGLPPRIREINGETGIVMIVWIACWIGFAKTVSHHSPPAFPSYMPEETQRLERERFDAREDSQRRNCTLIEMGGILVIAIVGFTRRNLASRPRAIT